MSYVGFKDSCVRDPVSTKTQRIVLMFTQPIDSSVICAFIEEHITYTLFSNIALTDQSENSLSVPSHIHYITLHC